MRGQAVRRADGQAARGRAARAVVLSPDDIVCPTSVVPLGHPTAAGWCKQFHEASRNGDMQGMLGRVAPAGGARGGGRRSGSRRGDSPRGADAFKNTV